MGGEKEVQEGKWTYVQDQKTFHTMYYGYIFNLDTFISLWHILTNDEQQNMTWLNTSIIKLIRLYCQYHTLREKTEWKCTYFYTSEFIRPDIDIFNINGARSFNTS